MTSVTSVAVPRATRRPSGRWVGGVCAGLAQHLGVPVASLRLIFLVLTLANGLGVLLYLGLWAVMPLAKDEPGAAQRGTDFGRLLAFGAVAIGLAVLFYGGWGPFAQYATPLIVVGLGVAIVWQQFISAEEPPDRKYRWLRPVAGIAIIVAGTASLLVGEIGWSQALQALSVVLLIVGGVSLLFLPLLLRLYRDAADQRRALIREQERTEIAAQVHDSVLQTLTLVQRNADDAERVRALARSEEHRLRSWLYTPAAAAPGTLAGALRGEAAKIEADHDATIEVIAVGDTALTEPTRLLLAAAAEAMTNAAKHAGPRAQVAVYCEVEDDGVQVSVRDRGPGFDPDAVAADRIGVRESIMGRMARIGGTVQLRARNPGMEVRLHVSLPQS
ncbi:MAG: PspC domain-containing protein [Actinobacteria bacterium]|nr:PspC domain-containing protein [Actinomycetota bacterium]